MSSLIKTIINDIKSNWECSSIPDKALMTCLGVSILLLLGIPPYNYLTERQEVFTVKDKGLSGDRADFIVYTDKDNVYKNQNSLLYWKWDSAELQSKIEKGKTYEATVNRLRIGALGMYPNILKIKEIKPNER